MQRRKTDSEEPPVAPGVRVLIVEDDEGYRIWLRTLVRRLGCTVAVAVDGTDALIKLTASQYDLLLSDLEMPKLDGLDLITHVRSHPTASMIYAVMITSRDDVQSRLSALTRGFDDFLPKSCGEVEVAAKVAAAGRLLARQKARDAELLHWRLLATRDELTNVATRRTFVEQARQQLADGRPASVLLFDLDDFKRINDTWGHLTGDRILRDVGALFLAHTRREDVVARFGGDEFIFLAPEVSMEEAAGIAERLVAAIGQLSWLAGTDTLRITASAGIAHSVLLGEPTVDALIDAADRDLYARKFLKKNPAAPPEELYEYPEEEHEGKVVSLPTAQREAQPPIAAKGPEEV